MQLLWKPNDDDNLRCQYQMPAIFTLTLSTIWAITVRIAVTDYELYNSTDNSAVQPSIQAVHPTAFHLPHFNNRLNSAITQFLPPPKTDTSMIYFAFSRQRRWSDSAVIVSKSSKAFYSCAVNMLRLLRLGFFPFVTVTKIKVYQYLLTTL